MIWNIVFGIWLVGWLGNIWWIREHAFEGPYSFKSLNFLNFLVALAFWPALWVAGIAVFIWESGREGEK